MSRNAQTEKIVLLNKEDKYCVIKQELIGMEQDVVTFKLVKANADFPPR